MLPDAFVFRVSSTGRLYHCIRSQDGKIELRHLECPNEQPAIWDEDELSVYISHGWEIVDVYGESEESDVNIDSLL